MCNLYNSTRRDMINLRHSVQLPEHVYAEIIAPLRPAPFVFANGASAVGQWGMIPHTSKTAKPMTSSGRPMSTNNCRRETMATAWTFRMAWQRSQRCLIPCDSFDEPYWGTGKNIWWRFWLADGQPWALAGLWDEWKDLATGEIVPNFTMITQNADAHPLMRLMHRLEKDKATGEILPPEGQDKRAVVPIEQADWDAWLLGTAEQAQALIRLPAMEVIRHAAADPTKQVELAG